MKPILMPVCMAGILLLCPIIGLSQAKKLVRTDTAVPTGSAKKSEQHLLHCSGTYTPPPFNEVFSPILFQEGIVEHESSENDLLDSIKTAKTAFKLKNIGSAHNSVGDGSSDGVGSSQIMQICHTFNANNQNGCPPDNTLAISSDGFIVSIVNFNIFMYRETGKLLSVTSFADYFGWLGAGDFLCDPKVLFDPVAGRFIMFVQECSGSSQNSNIIMAFSSSSDPTQFWYFYTFPGNILGNGTWFDYPRLAVNWHEVYVTGNLFKDNGGGFNQAILFQIEKDNAFSGGSINYQLWYDIPNGPFSLLPVSYPFEGSYGPGIYLIASERLGANYLNFYDLTNDLSAPDEQLLLYEVATDDYELPGNSLQSDNTQIDVADCRMMDGYYNPPYLHFVMGADEGNGWGAIRYYRLNVGNFSDINYFTTSLAGTKDYSYPSITAYTNNTVDHSSIIAFLANGAASFPEIRVKPFDNDFNTAASIQVKAGEALMSNCFNANAIIRWGDYSGITRKPWADVPTVWISGCYSLPSGFWGTWIAEIRDGACPVSGTTRPEVSTDILLAPNPASESILVNIESGQTQKCSFDLFDSSGKLIVHLTDATIVAGNNQFLFDVKSLLFGVYFLQVKNTENNVLKYEKLLVTH